MFRELINKPIDPIPVAYIANNLRRPMNEPDYSLTCFGIAMLKPRIEDYGGITGIYHSISERKDSLADFYERVNTMEEYPLFCYYKYNKSNESDKDFIAEHLSEFKEKSSISAFIKEKSDNECLVLYHEQKNAVGIFINSSDIRLYHLLLSFMSLYYPSLFASKPLTDKDYALIKSLSKKDHVEFYNCVRNLVQPYVKEFRMLQLSGLIKQMHEGKIQHALNDVNNQRATIDNLEQRYGEAIAMLKQLIVTYEGLKATENFDDAEKELVEYLSENKDIHNLDFRDHNLYFSVSTLLNRYNAEAWNTFKERGLIYDGDYGATHMLEVFNKKENRKLLLDNIFSEDPLLYIKICGNYQIDLRSCRLYTSETYDYVQADPIYKTYLPNPHLKIFGCLGEYKNRVMNALQAGNYVAAIELCVASAGSVNLDETTQTFRPFLGWLLSNREKVLVTKDGTEMTTEEALVWLSEREHE